jgi:hypothetical protein
MSAGQGLCATGELSAADADVYAGATGSASGEIKQIRADEPHFADR